MNEKDKAQILSELQKLRIEKYKQTRDIEFKVNIALWTLIVLIGYHFNEKLHLCCLRDLICFAAVSIVIVLAHYYLWLVPISDSLSRDGAKAYELEREIEVEAGFSASMTLRTLKNIKTDYHKWNFFLAGITLLLLLLLGVFLMI